MLIALGLVIVLVLVLLYLNYRPATAKERMISQAQYSLLSRGFNAPLAGDYSAMDIIYQAENADRTTDIQLTV